MKTIILLGLILCASSMISHGAPPTRADFFVSPVGNDSWSGKLEKPNAAATDGPFATIQRARDAVRALKSAGGQKAPIIVCLRGGTYFLSNTLELKPEDSGESPDKLVIYVAYDNEQPILSGGTRLTGLRVNRLNQWEAAIPEVLKGSWNFSQLFVDGARRFRPRLPKYSYYNIYGSAAPTAAVAARGFDRFIYKPGEIRSDWYDLNDVEALCFQTWTMARLRIAAADDSTHIVTFTGPTAGTAGYASLPKGNRYIVENVREALQDPGEWYLDRKRGVLTYIPYEKEKLGSTEMIAPKLEQLLVLKGDARSHKWVENIEFRSITFAHTNWNTPPQGNVFGQAEVNLNAAITAEGARNCSFTACTIKHTGAWAIELGAGCQHNTIESCEMTDLGAGGVKIGEMSIEQDPDMIARDNTVRNCQIAHCGRMHPAAVGAWIGQSPGNQIVHNRIADLYYTGISVGWTWGYGPSLARDNRIAYNLIEDVGQGVLSDMGGIYTLGISTGTTEDHNLIRNVESFDYGGWGIYTDEGSSNIQITNNIVFHTKTGGFHQHYGQDNHLTNNIFAYSREGQIIRTRPEDHVSFAFDHNIVIYKEGTLLGSNWSGDEYKLDDNVYWDESGRPVTFAGSSLEQWQTKGHDAGSVVADPLFTAADEGAFHFKQGSPALALGFKPIDYSQIGPHPTGGMKFSEAAPPRAFPPPPPPAPPTPIEESFEATPVGQTVPDAITSEEAGGGTVRVTDEDAFAGKHSLKFTDAAGQKFSYNPHLFWQPRFETGNLIGSFALKLKPGAIFYHEWRDNASPYNVGPSLRIDAAGALTASGRLLQQVPLDTWVVFKIECPIGDAAAGRYTLTVQIAGADAKRYADLPCSPQLKKITWFGFVSDTVGPSVFYLDEVKLHP